MKKSICSQRGSVNSFLLSALKSGDKYAYEISKAVKEISNGQYILKEASLYSGLKRLEAQGFLTSYSTNLENGLTRRYYSLTESGKQKLQSIDFSWDSEQKDNILKAINDSDPSSQKDIEKDLSEVTVKLNAITVSDEDDNLSVHHINENQQDLFNLMDFNNTNTGGKEPESITTENTEEIDEKITEENNTLDNLNLEEETIKLYVDTNNTNQSQELNSVNEFEFYNLKNDFKAKTTSFLDSVNNNEAKTFYDSSENALIKNFSSCEIKNNTHLQTNLSIENINTEINSENEKTSKEPEAFIAPVASISKININDIFGDLVKKDDDKIKDFSIAEEEANTSSLLNENIIEENINCTLIEPAKKDNKISNELEKNPDEENSSVAFDNKPIEEILDNSDKNLNELFESKLLVKKPSITVNNSVLYANQKIDLEKPSFDTIYANKQTSIYEIRTHKPIEPKQIKTNFVNVYKTKMISSISIVILQVILSLIIYFVFDKTKITDFTALQIGVYATCNLLLVIYAIINTVLYFTNKYKIVKSLDFKTNLFFKLLLGMCTLSCLFIIYKFFELDLLVNRYLLLLPISFIISIVFEELIKFVIIKK